jgi:beta-lactamase regulating signal transducer with metallopeptidase domain
MTTNQLKDNRRTIKAQIARIAYDIADVSTSHILHLILSIFTGVWIFVWIFCAALSRMQRKSLHKREVKLNSELEQIEEMISEDGGMH